VAAAAGVIAGAAATLEAGGAAAGALGAGAGTAELAGAAAGAVVPSELALGAGAAAGAGAGVELLHPPNITVAKKAKLAEKTRICLRMFFLRGEDLD
jgi:hypothetical protein